MEASVHADEDNNAYVGQQNYYVREEEEEEDRVDGDLSHFQPLQLEGQSVDGVVFHHPSAAKRRMGYITMQMEGLHQMNNHQFNITHLLEKKNNNNADFFFTS